MNTKHLLAVFLVTIAPLVGCSDAIDSDTTDRDDVSTASQPVTTNHVASMAPDGGGPIDHTWTAVEVVTDSSGNSYYAGNLWDDASVNFGCTTNPVHNPADSNRDAFLVKFDAQGNCLWQEFLFSDETSPQKKRIGFFGRDLTLSETENPVLTYSKGVDDPNGHYYTFPGLLTFSKSGRPTWQEEFTNFSRTTDSEFILEAIGVGPGRLYAAGRTNRSVSFAGSQVYGPLVIVAWGPPSGPANRRSPEWIREFGGHDYFGNPISDLAVDPHTSEATIVGSYGSTHDHLDGTRAADAQNLNMFIQTVDPTGQSVQGWASAPNPSFDFDHEYPTAVDFAPNGDLYIAGNFQGELDNQDELAPSASYLAADPNSYDNQDWFILKYDEAGDLPNKSTPGQLARVYLSHLEDSNYNSIQYESILDLEAGTDWIAYTGAVCDPTVECEKDDGYLEVSDSVPSNGSQKFGDLTRTHSNNGHLIGRHVALTSGNDRVWWSGDNSSTNYSYLGGSSLPGSDYFLATYDLIP